LGSNLPVLKPLEIASSETVIFFFHPAGIHGFRGNNQRYGTTTLQSLFQGFGKKIPGADFILIIGILNWNKRYTTLR
jgi:hypothetical protein